MCTASVIFMSQRVVRLHGICCALVYLHSLNPIVVHGDIKGDNVLVAGSPDHVQAKLAGFGLSRVLDPGRVASLGGTGMNDTQSCL